MNHLEAEQRYSRVKKQTPFFIILGFVFFFLIAPIHIWIGVLALIAMCGAAVGERLYWKNVMKTGREPINYDLAEIILTTFTLCVLTFTAVRKGGRNFALITMPFVWLIFIARVGWTMYKRKKNKGAEE